MNINVVEIKLTIYIYIYCTFSENQKESLKNGSCCCLVGFKEIFHIYQIMLPLVHINMNFLVWACSFILSIIVLNTCWKVSEIYEVRCCVGKKEGRTGNWTAKNDLFSGRFMYLSEKFNWETRSILLLVEQSATNPICTAVALFSGLAMLKQWSFSSFKIKNTVFTNLTTIFHRLRNECICDKCMDRRSVRWLWMMIAGPSHLHPSPLLNVDSSAEPLDRISERHVQVTKHPAGPDSPPNIQTIRPRSWFTA